MNTQTKIIGFVLLLVTAGWLGGCQKESPAKPEAAFAVIDGEPITVSFVSNTVMVSARIAELAKRPIKKDAFANWGNGFAAKITPQLIQAHLFDRELRQTGISPTPESEAATLANYNKKMHRKAASVDELAVLFGEQEGTFRQQFARESRFRAYYDLKGATTVSDEEIAVSLRNATNEIRKLRRIDAYAKSNARAAWDRLNAGEDWAIVATNCTEDALLDDHFVNYWKSWDEFELDTVEPEELKTALAALKVGGYTQPIELDEGLAIVRVNAREANTVACSRILFRMAVRKEMPSREAVIKELKKEKMAEAQREILKKARSVAKIEYPLGEKFSCVIWPVPQSSAKKHKK